MVARASPAVALTLFPRHVPVSAPADLNFQFTDIFNGILVNPIKLISFDDKTALALIQLWLMPSGNKIFPEESITNIVDLT